MANKQVESHEAARLNYEALEWYLERSELAAAKFADELSRAIAKIAEAPLAHSKPGHAPVFLSRFPFVIVYRELPHAIQIPAVARGHRRPGYGRKRLQPLWT